MWAPWKQAESREVAVHVDVGIWIEDNTVIFLLDGEAISREELAKPQYLKPGEHKLTVKRDDQVLQEQSFTVSGEETEQFVALHPPDKKPNGLAATKSSGNVP